MLNRYLVRLTSANICMCFKRTIQLHWKHLLKWCVCWSKNLHFLFSKSATWLIFLSFVLNKFGYTGNLYLTLKHWWLCFCLNSTFSRIFIMDECVVLRHLTNYWYVRVLVFLLGACYYLNAFYKLSPISLIYCRHKELLGQVTQIICPTNFPLVTKSLGISFWSNVSYINLHKIGRPIFHRLYQPSQLQSKWLCLVFFYFK